MQEKNNSANQKSNEPHDLGQIIANPEESMVYVPHETKKDQRQAIEELVETLEGANLTATIKALNGIERGSYFVKIGNSSEWNEITVRLYDNPRGKPIASGYIDKGHTTASKFEAASDLRELVRAYLCR